ncbi:toprim domain-containing protein [Brevibacillus laterosporus]|uniref:toprim domain-containing protein n=1 Tax=Brevibacillus laterosporus TaxID=1465 RepID=UPI00264C5E44|nr:toprim domain-containing protein [Brevibacillus laterosporus]MDN9010023.1 toprim domain-containing protein [Brevibacillus laterosporus]MDO0940595.1 toprim domain-containing protein [Brevibacillus laterosporus]
MEIDIRAELEQFSWTAATWTDDKLLAASPFRWDRSPSFYVWLRDSNDPRNKAKAGYWSDMGAKDPDYQRGGIVKLLAFLREETEEETQDYLRWKYGEGTVDPETLTLDLSGRLRIDQPRIQPLDEQYLGRDHPYLASRGITDEIQQMFRTGYDPRTNAITIPWFNADGTLGNVKYRKVNEKTFWYAKGGRPIREMVYGLDIVYKQRITRAVLVESEIDAMYLWSAGVPAVALGGSVFSEEKAEALRKSPIEIIGVMADHDSAGQKMKRAVVGGLSGYMAVNVVGYPFRYKDPNEIKNSAELMKYYMRAFTSKNNFININICIG